MLLTRWLGLAAMGVAVLAAAQTPPEKVITLNSVSFVSGGVGVDSEERLKAREKEFNLKLVFTLVEGNYLADIGVTVKDAAGKTLVEHLADGPFFMAKLPAGAYTVAVSNNGRTQSRKVTVRTDRLRSEYFRWKSNPETDFVLSPEQRRE